MTAGVAAAAAAAAAVRAAAARYANTPLRAQLRLERAAARPDAGGRVTGSRVVSESFPSRFRVVSGSNPHRHGARAHQT